MSGRLFERTDAGGVLGPAKGAAEREAGEINVCVQRSRWFFILAVCRCNSRQVFVVCVVCVCRGLSWAA